MEKQVMASLLLSCQGLCEPGERLIFKLSVREEYWLEGRPTVHNSINGRSFLLCEFLRKNHHDLDWLAPQVLLSNLHWKTNKSC